MAYEIAISPLAKQEIFEAYDWYELAKKGLGDEFLLNLDNFFDSLLQNPKTYSYYQKPVRYGLLKKFPYSVTYEIAEEKILIYSVFMAKQNPSKRRTS